MSDAASSAASLSTLLRERTRDSHERTEAAVGATLDLTGLGLTRDRYARLLERWYGFEAAWQHAGPAALPELGEAYFAPRRKLALLTADLHFLGRTDADVATLSTVPAAALPGDRDAALGMLYVVEGSTLGGQHVAKSVRAHLGFPADGGTHYFASYGPDVGRRWRETKALLDAPPFPTNVDSVVAGAVGAFEFLREWLTASGPLSRVRTGGGTENA